ncbi:hypothetical protein Hanom_Chr00s000004g01609391 [Helianthus anomalus]
MSSKWEIIPIHNPHIAGSKFTNPWIQTLNHLSSSSLARAHYLKHPKDNSSATNSQFSSKTNSQISLFPHRRVTGSNTIVCYGYWKQSCVVPLY